MCACVRACACACACACVCVCGWTARVGIHTPALMMCSKNTNVLLSWSKQTTANLNTSGRANTSPAALHFPSNVGTFDASPSVAPQRLLVSWQPVIPPHCFVPTFAIQWPEAGLLGVNLHNTQCTITPLVWNQLQSLLYGMFNPPQAQCWGNSIVKDFHEWEPQLRINCQSLILYPIEQLTFSLQ